MKFIFTLTKGSCGAMVNAFAYGYGPILKWTEWRQRKIPGSSPGKIEIDLLFVYFSLLVPFRRHHLHFLAAERRRHRICQLV